ncbi:hypothetical protein M5689_005952 [Euphorbia peplus]|nr:hypothetical protein M5689_005952 [Euphorbia peplus]
MMKLVQVIFAAFLLLSLQVHASRVLYDINLGNMQSLQRGTVPGSGSSGCTHIPGTDGPPCPANVNSMNVAGKALSHGGGAYPRLVVDFGVAVDRRSS